MTVFLIIAFLITGIVIGFFLGKKYNSKNVVLDAIIDATNQEVNKSKKLHLKDFSIEHYPLTKRYYPMYKDYYLLKDHSTGIIEKKESYLFPYAKYFDTENEALNFIELAKEQLLKVNVVRIKL